MVNTGANPGKGQEQRDRLYAEAGLDIPHAIVPKKGTLEEL